MDRRIRLRTGGERAGVLGDMFDVAVHGQSERRGRSDQENGSSTEKRLENLKGAGGVKSEAAGRRENEARWS